MILSDIVNRFSLTLKQFKETLKEQSGFNSVVWSLMNKANIILGTKSRLLLCIRVFCFCDDSFFSEKTHHGRMNVGSCHPVLEGAHRGPMGPASQGAVGFLCCFFGCHHLLPNGVKGPGLY